MNSLLFIMYYSHLIVKLMLTYHRQSGDLCKWQNKPPITLFKLSTFHHYSLFSSVRLVISIFITLSLALTLSPSLLYSSSIYLYADFSWSIILLEFFNINLQNMTLKIYIIFHFIQCHNHLDQSFLIVHTDCFQVFIIINEFTVNILYVNIWLLLNISLGLIPLRVWTLKGQMLFRKLLPMYPAPAINVNVGLAAYFSLSLIKSVAYFIFVERVIRDCFQILVLAYNLLWTIVGAYMLLLILASSFSVQWIFVLGTVCQVLRIVYR